MDKVENWQKMSCDNPKLGIVNNNMYAKYDPNQFFHKILSGNQFWAQIKGP